MLHAARQPRSWLIFDVGQKMKLTDDQLVNCLFTLNPELPPEAKTKLIALVESSPEGAKRSEIIKGIKEGFKDSLLTARRRPPEERRMIETSLAAKGLPSLRKMEAGLRKTHRRILARGEIKNEEEMHLVSDILADLTFDITESDRRRLEELSAAYELRKKYAQPVATANSGICHEPCLRSS
jgi:hypothetical protein